MPSHIRAHPDTHELLGGMNQAEVVRQIVSADLSAAAIQSEASVAKALERLLKDNSTDWWLKPERAPYRRGLLRVCPGLRDSLPVEADAGEYPLGDFPSVGDVSLMDSLPELSDSFELLEGAPSRAATWLEAPAGAGKSLCCRRLRASRPDLRVRVVRTLADGAALPRGNAPLLLDVQQEGPAAEDAAAAESLLRTGSVRILARFPPPRDGPLPIVSDEAGWKIRSWRALPGWRPKYVVWALTRAGQPQLVQQALDLLDRLDPGGSWFDTPGIVQGLLAALVRGGIEGEQPDDTVLRAAGVVLRQRASRSVNAWCRAGGEEAVLAIAKARMQRPEVPWDEAISTSLVDAALGKRLPTGGLRWLTDAGLLREVGPGQFRCEPFWVWQGLGADAVMSLVATRDVAQWGRAGSGDDRARHLAHALAVLDERQFWRLANDVVDAWKSERTLVHASAVEACFSCAAKRGAAKGRSRAAARLWKAQRELWVDNCMSAPSTRPGLGDGFEEACAWVSDCWGWSFEFAKPDDVLTADLEAWLWPGWCRPRFDEMPVWLEHALGSPSMYESKRSDWPAGFREMVERVPEVVKRAVGEPSADLRCVVTPYLAVERRDPGALKRVAAGESWMVTEVNHLLSRRGEKDQQAVADEMLDSLSRQRSLLEALTKMKQLFPGLWRRLGPVENPREKFEHPERVPQLIDALPPGLLTHVLLDLAGHRDVAMALADVALRLDAKGVLLDVAVWHRVLGHGAEGVHDVARAAWKADEEATEALLRDTWGNPLGLLLWSEAPARAKVRMLQASSTDASPLGTAEDEGFRRELRRLVRTDPEVAEAAWQLLQSLS